MFAYRRSFRSGGSAGGDAPGAPSFQIAMPYAAWRGKQRDVLEHGPHCSKRGRSVRRADLCSVMNDGVSALQVGHVVRPAVRYPNAVARELVPKPLALRVIERGLVPHD